MARGEIHSFDRNRHKQIGRRPVGKCPVDGCDVPVRPADIIEDVGIRGVLDACRQLVAWSDTSQGAVDSCEISNRAMRRVSAECTDSFNLFEDDATLGQAA